MLNTQVRAELAKIGVSGVDLDAAPSTMSWAQLHDARKRARTAVNRLPKSADGEAAFNVIGERIADISDEIDTRESRGEREPNAARLEAERTAPRRQALEQAHQEAARAPRPSGVSTSPYRSSALIEDSLAAGFRPLEQGESFADRLGRGARGPSVADLVRTALGLEGGAQASQSGITGGAGGFAIPTTTAGFILDAARAASIANLVGVSFMPVPQGRELTIPILANDPTPTWRGELVGLDESSAALTEFSLQANTLGVLIRMSEELVQDAPGLDAFLNRVLGQTVALAMDAAVFNGDGIGKPRGIANTPGIGEIAVNGALSNYDAFSRMVQYVRQRNLEPGNFVTSPSVAGELERLKDLQNQPLQPPRSVADRQFFTSTSIDAIGNSPQSATALTGFWPDAFVLPKTGIILEASRDAGNNFAELAVSVRAWVRFDAAVARASSFVKATGITTNIE